MHSERPDFFFCRIIDVYSGFDQILYEPVSAVVSIAFQWKIWASSRRRTSSQSHLADSTTCCLTLFRASEEAVNLLIAAQQKCGEMYVSSPEPALKIISLPVENEEA